MTMYVGQEKPSLEDLEHYGVLGMKWGKTRAKASGSDIRSSRARLRKQVRGIQGQREVVAGTNKGSKERAKEGKKLADMTTAYLKNPDRVTATRLTRGEKAVAIFLLTPGGAAAAIGATSAASRRIERKQELGKYDKNK